MHRYIVFSLLVINLLLVYVHCQDFGGEGGSGSAWIDIGANSMSRVTGGNGGRGGSTSGSGPCFGGRGGNGLVGAKVGRHGMAFITGGQGGMGGNDGCRHSLFRRSIKPLVNGQR